MVFVNFIRHAQVSVNQLIHLYDENLATYISTATVRMLRLDLSKLGASTQVKILKLTIRLTV